MCLRALTISSLHIGHTSLVPAAAAAVEAILDSPWSIDILDAMSCDSEEGGVEVWELRERLLGDGERR